MFTLACGADIVDVKALRSVQRMGGKTVLDNVPDDGTSSQIAVYLADFVSSNRDYSMRKDGAEPVRGTATEPDGAHGKLLFAHATSISAEPRISLQCPSLCRASGIK
jgi:hypothetical protein